MKELSIEQELFFMRQLQYTILVNQEKQMAAIENLTANLTKLKTDVDALVASKTAATEAAIQTAADAVAAIDAEVVAATPAA